MYASILITYIPNPADTAELSSSAFALQLVQEEFDFRSVGSFDEWLEANGVELTAATVISAYEQYRSACTADGALEVGLRVYLSDPTTPYTLVSSYGELSEGELVEDVGTERLNLDLADQAAIDFGTITEAAFEGEVRDQEGEIIAGPALTIDGGSITAPQEVDGTAVVTRQVQYWRHTLTLQPRDLSEEQLASEDFSIGDLYAATVRLYAGGEKDQLDVAMPEDWGTCEGGYAVGGAITDPGDEDPGEYEVVFEAFDYCTGDPITGATFTVDGLAIGDPSGGTVIEGGAHTIVVSADGYTTSSEDDLDENDTFTLSGGE